MRKKKKKKKVYVCYGMSTRGYSTISSLIFYFTNFIHIRRYCKKKKLETRHSNYWFFLCRIYNSRIFIHPLFMLFHHTSLYTKGQGGFNEKQETDSQSETSWIDWRGHLNTAETHFYANLWQRGLYLKTHLTPTTISFETANIHSRASKRLMDGDSGSGEVHWW